MLYDALFGPSGRERDVAAGGDIFTDDSFGIELFKSKILLGRSA